MYVFKTATSVAADYSKAVKDGIAAAEAADRKRREEDLKGEHQKLQLHQLATNPSPGYTVARLLESLDDRNVSASVIASRLQDAMLWLYARSTGDAVPSAIHNDETVMQLFNKAFKRVHSALHLHDLAESEAWDDIENASEGLHGYTYRERSYNYPPHVDPVEVCLRALAARQIQEE